MFICARRVAAHCSVVPFVSRKGAKENKELAKPLKSRDLQGVSEIFLMGFALISLCASA
jgi:hypothetical protein